MTLRQLASTAYHELRYRLTPSVVTCNVDGLKIKIAVSSRTEYYRARTYATKEPETIWFLNTYLKPSSVFYDIGANIGLYSLYAAKREPKCTVVAFEPENKNLWALHQNIHRNGLDNIHVYNRAFSDRTGVGTLLLGSNESGGACHSVQFRATYTGDVQGVILITIDEFLQYQYAPFPTLLKLDVDGHEAQVLKGAQKTLADTRLKALIVEFTAPPDQPVNFAPITVHGFKFVKRSEWQYRMPNGDVAQNYVFEREP